MSRIGKKPIPLPEGVDVSVNGQTVVVKGAKGALQETLNDAVTVLVAGADGAKEIQVTARQEDAPGQRAQWGTARALIANMVVGVTSGFTKQLEVNGVGYRVSVQGRTLVLSVGFSHEVKIELPEGVDAAVEGNMITITGASKHAVGAFADRVRKIRKPEPYKGKGIKYVDETIRRKAGKSQKAGE